VVPARHSYLIFSHNLSLSHENTKLQEVLPATLSRREKGCPNERLEFVSCQLSSSSHSQWQTRLTRWCQWPYSINIVTVPVTSCHVSVGPHSSEDHLACMNPYTRLSNHVYPLAIRSSAPLGDTPPDATNIRQEFQWVWCLRPHRPWQRREVGVPALVNQRSCARINWKLAHRCVDKSTLPQIFGAYPPEFIKVSLPALHTAF